MKAVLFILLFASVTGIALLGCDDDEKEAPERVLTLSIDAPASVEAELCEFTDSVEIIISARDQFDQEWNNVAVICTVGIDIGSFGFHVDTVFVGSTESNGDIHFLFPVDYDASIITLYELRVWAEGDSIVFEMTVVGFNEGPLGVYVSVEPDTMPVGMIPDSVLTRIWFMYDFGGPANELFTLHPEIGLLSDSVLFVDNSYIETYWHLPESLPVGRYSIVVDYSNSPCLDWSDTTWVTIIP